VEFDDAAVSAIAEFSSGTPRLINMACDRALLAAFNEETDKIGSGIVKKCLEELDSYFVGGRA
jgi:general secretion pathway protein A